MRLFVSQELIHPYYSFLIWTLTTGVWVCSGSAIKSDPPDSNPLRYWAHFHSNWLCYRKGFLTSGGLSMQQKLSECGGNGEWGAVIQKIPVTLVIYLSNRVLKGKCSCSRTEICMCFSQPCLNPISFPSAVGFLLIHCPFAPVGLFQHSSALWLLRCLRQAPCAMSSSPWIWEMPTVCWFITSQNVTRLF